MEQFKKAKVIMLSTENKTNIIFDKNQLEYIKKSQIATSINSCVEGQYLYIISDDKIKEGYLYHYLGNIYKAKGLIRFHETILSSCKKIIATTDTSLFTLVDCPIRGATSSIKYILPQPSQQFIEKYIESYNKSEVITDVLVEYNNLVEDVYGNKHLQTENDGELYLRTCKIISSNVKVNPEDNTITIKELKNNWNREEVIKLLKLSWKESDSQYDKDDYIFNGKEEISAITYFKKDMNKWIEKNI